MQEISNLEHMQLLQGIGIKDYHGDHLSHLVAMVADVVSH